MRYQLFQTKNSGGSRETCWHCKDTGNVVLDCDGALGAPCPMCVIGRNVAVGRKFEWKPSMLDRWTWENGLTVQHSRRCRLEGCVRPTLTSSTWCDFHLNRDHRVPGWQPESPADVFKRFGTMRISTKPIELTPEEIAAINRTKGINTWKKATA